MADGNLQRNLNVSIGLKAKFMDTWDIMGGYEFESGVGKHLCVIKQTNAGEDTNEIPLDEFLDKFLVAINSFTAKKTIDEDQKAKDQKQFTELKTNDNIRNFLSVWRVYVKEVYIKIEQTGEEEPDVEYAFWVGIEVTTGVEMVG